MWRICAFSMYTISRYIAEIHYIYLVYFVNCSHGEIFCFIFRFAKHIFQSIFFAVDIAVAFQQPFAYFTWFWSILKCNLNLTTNYMHFSPYFPFSCFPGMTIEIYVLCNDVHCTHTHTHTQFLYLFFSSYCVYVHSFVCLSTWNILERNGIQVHGFHDCWIQFAKSLWSYFGNGIRAQLYSIYFHNFIPFVLSMEIIRPKYVR